VSSSQNQNPLKTVRFALICAALALLAAATGYWARGYLNHPEASDEAKTGNADGLLRLPTDVTFNDLTGQAHALTEWQGKLVLLNFWASWCGPCLDEMPLLLAMQRKYGAAGLQIIGPAVDDPEAAQQVVADLHLDFPVLVGTPEAMLGLMTKLGNSQGGLPFSLLVSADGRVLTRQLGQFSSKAELEALIEPNLPRR
jgi:thiol-disulfide isomerase/thioredoxin